MSGASPTIGKLEARQRKNRAVKQRIRPDQVKANEPFSVQDQMPVEHKESNEQFLEQLRARKAFKSAGLLGQDNILGQLTYDESMIDRARDAAEPEIENARRAILEDIVYDLSDGYQRKQAESVMPWITSSRQDIVGRQIEQFAFLTKLQMKAAFSDTSEIVRLLMLLGGRERLIYLNNVATAPTATSSTSMWDGIKQTLSRDRPDPRFLLGYNDDQWFQEASDGGSPVRLTLENLAVCYVHLFPKLMLGKLDPFSADQINDRAKYSRSAKSLVESALQFCLTQNPAMWLKNVLTDGSLGEHTNNYAPATFGGQMLGQR